MGATVREATVSQALDGESSRIRKSLSNKRKNVGTQLGVYLQWQAR